MRNIIKILLVIFIGTLLACSNNQKPKGPFEPNKIGNIMYRNIEFKSQGAILRGRLYLQEDKIDFLINQNPNDQGYLGVMSIFKHLILKEKVEQIQYLPLDIVVKENVKYYLKRQKQEEFIL